MLNPLCKNQAGKWTPISPSRTGPKISHLFFANDVLLFTKAKPCQARLIANVLQEFCSISGLKVSLEKSRALAAKGVQASRKAKIRSITQINFTNNLGKYLGFRIIQGRQRREDFTEAMERMDSKLASWKGKLLNKPGRLTLANSVLSATPVYGMQLAWYPQYVFDHMDRTLRNFIWKGHADKGLHVVGWEKVTQPTKLGGLGVRLTCTQNTSLLGKLA